VITAVLISVVIFPLISFLSIVVVSEGGIPSIFPSIVKVSNPLSYAAIA
jgi:hypothetical protein